MALARPGLTVTDDPHVFVVRKSIHSTVGCSRCREFVCGARRRSEAQLSDADVTRNRKEPCAKLPFQPLVRPTAYLSSDLTEIRERERENKKGFDKTVFRGALPSRQTFFFIKWRFQSVFRYSIMHYTIGLNRHAIILQHDLLSYWEILILPMKTPF